MSLSPIDRIRLDKAAVDEGFGLARPPEVDWLVYEGLGTPAVIRLTFAEGEYVVAVNHPGVVADLAQRWPVRNFAGELPTGYSAFCVADTAPLHRLVGEVRRLARALPNEPLRIFEAAVRDLPRGTEIARLTVQRIGQQVFREALLVYWGGQCAVTGVTDTRLLRASHIKPWAECALDAERLDVYNGLLLAAHYDAAFDAGLISFSDTGGILFSPAFAETDRQALGMSADARLRLVAPGHAGQLAWHRERVFLKEGRTG